MNDSGHITQAVERACQEKSLLDALTWICVWESERIIKQAKKGLKDADGKGLDTCFRVCFRVCLKEVMEKYDIT